MAAFRRTRRGDVSQRRSGNTQCVHGGIVRPSLTVDARPCGRDSTYKRFWIMSAQARRAIRLGVAVTVRAGR